MARTCTGSTNRHRRDDGGPTSGAPDRDTACPRQVPTPTRAVRELTDLPSQSRCLPPRLLRHANRGRRDLTGTYRLVTREPDDHGDTAVGATEVTVGGDAEAVGINYNDGQVRRLGAWLGSPLNRRRYRLGRSSASTEDTDRAASVLEQPLSALVMILTTCPGSTHS